MERVKRFLMNPCLENTIPRSASEKGTHKAARKPKASSSSSNSTTTSPNRPSTIVSQRSAKRTSTLSPNSKLALRRAVKAEISEDEGLGDVSDYDESGLDEPEENGYDDEDDETESLRPHNVTSTTSSSTSNGRSNSNNDSPHGNNTSSQHSQLPQRKKRGPNRPKTARELFMNEHKTELLAQLGRAAYRKLDDMWDALSKTEQARYENRVSELWNRKPSPATAGGVGMSLSMAAATVIPTNISGKSVLKTDSTASSTTSSIASTHPFPPSNHISALASQSSLSRRKRGRPPSAATLAARAAGILGPHESLSSRGISTSQISITQYEVDSGEDDNDHDSVNSNGKRIRNSVTISELPAPPAKRKRGRPPKQQLNSTDYDYDDDDYDNNSSGGLVEKVGSRRFEEGMMLEVESDTDEEDERTTIYYDSSVPLTDQQLIDEINRILKGMT